MVPQRYLASFSRAAANPFFVALAKGKEPVFVKIQVAAFFAVIFKNLRQDDGVHRAAFFAKATENTPGQINVVARCPLRAIVAFLHFHRDGSRRARRRAQPAGDAAFLAVCIAAQGRQPPKARRERRFFFRILERQLARECLAPGQGHAAHEFKQQKALEKILDGKGPRQCRHVRLTSIYPTERRASRQRQAATQA